MKYAPSTCSWVIAALVGMTTFAIRAHAQNAKQYAAKNEALRAVIRANGTYELDFPASGWKLDGKLPGDAGDLHSTAGNDKIGAYHQISASFDNGMRIAEIRVYDVRPLVLFRDVWKSAGQNALPFPAFQSLPQGAFRFSYQKRAFGYYEFGKLGPEGPWCLFDRQGHAMVISPADHFLVSDMEDQPDGVATSGIDPAIKQMPAGFVHSTLIAAGTGINSVFGKWGSALLALGAKQRPANNADVTLARLGYWTDNKTTYYYRFEPQLGYRGTLLAVRGAYRKLGVALGYMQLDSWFYPKGPQSRWNAGGSTIAWGEDEYRADKKLFPQGLANFHLDLGLPLVTHARWVAPASPYRHEFKMSGNVVIDPRFWQQTAHYLHQAGVVTYEQDWLNRNAQTAANLTDPALFLGNMSKAMAAEGISIMYCMPLPGDYMASTHYPNVQMIRPSDDGFARSRWDSFLYDSRLASAVGLWPWTDASFSHDLGNLVIATLSAGPVGVGDAIGNIDVKNLLAVERTDGVIVKPDTSLLPIDAVYRNDAEGEQAPMVASATTRFGKLQVHYVFSYPRQSSGAQTSVPLRELGISGPVFAYNWVTHQGQPIPVGGNVHMEFKDGWAYEVLSPITSGGIALLGDTAQITPLGRARVSSLRQNGQSLTASIRFASRKSALTISGYASRRPVVKALSGTLAGVSYDQATHMFNAQVSPAKSREAIVQISAQ